MSRFLVSGLEAGLQINLDIYSGNSQGRSVESEQLQIDLPNLPVKQLETRHDTAGEIYTGLTLGVSDIALLDYFAVCSVLWLVMIVTYFIQKDLNWRIFAFSIRIVIFISEFFPEKSINIFDRLSVEKW